MNNNPEQNSENEIPLTHDFICTGLVERIANWARFFCFGFLFIQLLAIVINLINPFTIDPPQPFYQLLFFLLACAAFEIFAIPIESIKDHCIIDLHKMVVVKVYHRFFYTRVEVLTTFEKIKTIGVSARPAPLLKGIFSESTNRYALMMVTEKNKLYRITDFNLSLEKANRIAKDLHESSLRQADVVYGSENTELCLDKQVTGSFIPQPCHRSALTLIDAALIPAFEAAGGVMLVIIFISITAILGDFVSTELFNTKLKIANQPVFQLLLARAKPDPEAKLTPPEGPPPDLPFKQEDLVSNAPVEDSAPPPETKSPDLTVASSVVATETTLYTALPEVATSSSNGLQEVQINTPEDSTIAKIDQIAFSEKTTVKPDPELIKPVIAQNESSLPGSTESIKPEPKEKPKSEPKPEVKTGAKQKSKPEPRPEPKQKSNPETQPVTGFLAKSETSVLMPLPSRIPSLDETAVLEKISDDEDFIRPVKIVIPAQPKTPLTVASANDPHNRTDIKPVFYSGPKNTTPASDQLLKTNNSINRIAELKKPPVILSNSPATTNKTAEVSAASYVGQSVSEAVNSLGKPITRIKSSNGEQLIYSGITLLTDLTGEKITQVNLTSHQSKLLGAISTKEGLRVGNMVREAKARLGIPQTRKGSAGLHFPERGISIYPLPGNPETIGSIQLYQPKSQSSL